MTLVAAGFTHADVLELTLAQVRELGAAVESRRKLARTELLVMLRAARYDGKKGSRAYQDLLKASRTTSWLIPA